MNKMKLVVLLRNSKITSNRPNVCSILSRWYSKNEGDDPTKSQAKTGESDKKDEKSKIILNKLNTLLTEMVEKPVKGAPSPLLKLSKPVPRQDKKGPVQTPKKVEKEEEKVVNAIHEVAQSLGGDTKQTELELMKKLLNNNEEDKSTTISSLSDIFKGMKIDRSEPKLDEHRRSQQIKQILSRTQGQQRGHQEQRLRSKPRSMGKSQPLKLDNIDLYGKEPLGIFNTDLSEYTEGVKTTTWETLKQREMKLSVTHPPSNYFQQMILWTEQGKLWKFPIDNEQGLEKEQNVSFTEHIFLEQHLEPWCPPKGPIRHFMELVCVGLSKNHYLPVESKREHIEWYRNYFEDKRQLLQEVGVSLNDVKSNDQLV